jgi:gas vesicle protein
MREGKYEASAQGGVGTAITFLLIGLGAGTLIGLLFAPRSGKQMRGALRRRYQHARGNLEDWAGDARQTVGEALERGADVADEIRDRVSPLVESLKRR